MSEARKPLKILILLNRVPYPLNDGGAIGAYNFVRGYAEAGCDVTMLSMNTTRHFVDEEKVQELFGRYGTIYTVKIDNRIKPLDALINLFTNKSYILQRFVSANYNSRLIEILKQNDFDIVHVDGLPPTAYIETVRAHSKAKVIMRAHNVEHVIWLRSASEDKNPLKRWYLGLQANRLKKYELAAFVKTDLVMAISREDQQIIRNSLPDAVTTVVPAGLDVAENIPSESTGEFNLFFIGAFDWLPNLQGIEWFFENAWQHVAKQFPELKFVIAGKKMPDSFSRYAGPGVVLAGEVPDAKQFIKEHEVMLVPLVSGSGIRIKIVEAMALGKAIIATSIAAEGLGLSDGENILIADTPEQFVQQIAKCMNAEFRKRIALNAHQFALENFQNKRIFERLVKTL